MFGLTAASAFCICTFINPRSSSPIYQITQFDIAIPSGGSIERSGDVAFEPFGEVVSSGKGLAVESLDVRRIVANEIDSARLTAENNRTISSFQISYSSIIFS